MKLFRAIYQLLWLYLNTDDAFLLGSGEIDFIYKMNVQMKENYGSQKAIENKQQMEILKVFKEIKRNKEVKND